MVQLWLDAKGLTTLGKMLHLPLRHTDTGYLTHCALGELFGDQAPKPFSVEQDAENGRHIRLLGYCETNLDTLHSYAQLDASPTVYDMAVWERCASKPMPDTFPEAMRLRFELRACPVVRKASAGEGPDGQRWKKGEELDAFLSEAWEHPDKKLSREQIYRDWLIRQFDLRGGAEPESIGMTRFSIERMTRRTHGGSNGNRNVRTIQRPDVTLSGTLRVAGGDAFVDLLRSGIGRHKSFGYGMLKVRRA